MLPFSVNGHGSSPSGAYHPIVVEISRGRSRGKNQKKSEFSDTQKVTTGKPNLDRFRGGSKVKINIGNLASEILPGFGQKG